MTQQYCSEIEDYFKDRKATISEWSGFSNLSTFTETNKDQVFTSVTNLIRLLRYHNLVVPDYAYDMPPIRQKNSY
jgi:hypothetical protein